MSLAILFHFLRAQHVSDINIYIIRSLRLCCWITTSVVLFCKDVGFSVSVNLWCLVLCVWCDVFCRFVVVGKRISVDIDHNGQYQRKITSHQTHNTKHHKLTLTLDPPSLQNETIDVVIQQHSRKLLMTDILMFETCWAHKKWNKIASDIKLVFLFFSYHNDARSNKHKIMLQLSVLFRVYFDCFMRTQYVVFITILCLWLSCQRHPLVIRRRWK